MWLGLLPHCFVFWIVVEVYHYLDFLNCTLVVYKLVTLCCCNGNRLDGFCRFQWVPLILQGKTTIKIYVHGRGQYRTTAVYRDEQAERCVCFLHFGQMVLCISFFPFLHCLYLIYSMLSLLALKLSWLMFIYWSSGQDRLTVRFNDTFEIGIHTVRLLLSISLALFMMPLSAKVTHLIWFSAKGCTVSAQRAETDTWRSKSTKIFSSCRIFHHLVSMRGDSNHFPRKSLSIIVERWLQCLFKRHWGPM